MQEPAFGIVCAGPTSSKGVAGAVIQIIVPIFLHSRSTNRILGLLSQPRRPF